MQPRTRILAGSLTGALAIHIALVACSGSPEPTAPGRDGGGGIVDAITDALDAIIDGEVKDAHAGGDAGTACNCEPAQPEYTFSGGAVTVREGVAPQEPQRDFSTASVDIQTVRGSGGAVNAVIDVTVGYFLADGGNVQVSCRVWSTADGQVVPRTRTDPSADAGTASYDTLCGFPTLYNGPSGSGLVAGAGSSSIHFSGARINQIDDTHVSLTLPPVLLPRREQDGPPSGTVTIAPITVRATIPGGRIVTMPRAYAP